MGDLFTGNYTDIAKILMLYNVKEPPRWFAKYNKGELVYVRLYAAISDWMIEHRSKLMQILRHVESGDKDSAQSCLVELIDDLENSIQSMIALDAISDNKSFAVNMR